MWSGSVWTAWQLSSECVVIFEGQRRGGGENAVAIVQQMSRGWDQDGQEWQCEKFALSSVACVCGLVGT